MGLLLMLPLGTCESRGDMRLSVVVLGGHLVYQMAIFFPDGYAVPSIYYCATDMMHSWWGQHPHVIDVSPHVCTLLRHVAGCNMSS